MDAQNPALLAGDEPAPPFVVNAGGRSAFVLVCDHAGKAFPRRLGDLGLPPPERERHIAWDIGAENLARLVSESLDAILIGQPYSRLTIDCNRPPEAADSIPQVSESTPVPGNAGLDEAARGARRREIFDPYHDRIARELDRRAAAGQDSVLIAVHSFTPVYKGVARPWHCGLLSGRDRRLAVPLLDLLRREPDLVVGDNEPYAVSDASDYTIPVHGERRGLVHVGLEIRQDLVATTEGQARWARLLARLLPQAWSSVRR